MIKVNDFYIGCEDLLSHGDTIVPAKLKCTKKFTSAITIFKALALIFFLVKETEMENMLLPQHVLRNKT